MQYKIGKSSMKPRLSKGIAKTFRAPNHPQSQRTGLERQSRLEDKQGNYQR